MTKFTSKYFAPFNGIGYPVAVMALVLTITLSISNYAQDSKSKPARPATVDLNPLQKLTYENLTLKLEALNNQRLEILREALRGAGVAEADWSLYQFDPAKGVFTKVTQKKAQETEKDNH